MINSKGEPPETNRPHSKVNTLLKMETGATPFLRESRGPLVQAGAEPGSVFFTGWMGAFWESRPPRVIGWLMRYDFSSA